MADKICPQCNETVDEAKAFCPACGYAFVEEETRTDTSAYEQMDHTVQMGQTMYNNMLSDMGLKKAEVPAPEKRVEELRPVVVQPAQPLQPVAGTQGQAPPQTAEKKSSKKIWITTVVVALALLLIFAIAVIVVGLYLYFRSGRF